MIDTEENQKFEQVVRKIDPLGKLLRSWELRGGISAQVTALEVLLASGETLKMVVRQHGAVDLKNNPQIAADEFKLLNILHNAGIAVPAPYFLDQSGDIFPIPYLVIEFVEGEAEFALSNVPDYIPQFATHLSRIHQVDCSKVDVSFLPRQEQRYADKLRERPEMLNEVLDEGRVRDVLEEAWPLKQWNDSVVLHGDYWPGNVLWKDGRLAGIVDWEDAALGDPLYDLANSRLEILWAFGSDAMHEFTETYQSLMPIDYSNLPYWDLCVALRHISLIDGLGLDEETTQTMRERHRWFVAWVFERLGV